MATSVLRRWPPWLRRSTLFTTIKNQSSNRCYLLTTSRGNFRLAYRPASVGLIKGYSSSSSENEDKFDGSLEHTIISEKDIRREPPRERFGVLKTLVVIIAGVYFGAWLAMVGATVLEDLEIFVDEDDDDDD